MDRLDAMQAFVRVIEKGSFSAVAKERGIGQPAVSKQISALEEELGTELIHPPLARLLSLRQVATFTGQLCAFSTTLKARLRESVEARPHRKASSV
jgi:hypothetical protein